MKNFVVSDIDGTLVPHPYTSGLSPQQRTHSVERLGRLTAQSHFSVVTGREWDGYLRLFHECGLVPRYPQALGVEFGAFVYARERVVSVTLPPLKWPELLQSVRNACCAFGKAVPLTGPGSPSALGRLGGYVIEEKNAVLQMEWNLDTAQENAAFARALGLAINPFLLPGADLYAQVFYNRVDVFPKEFIPKGTFWPKFLEIYGDSINWSETNLFVLGDELYDSYMFEFFKKHNPSQFNHVTCISVGHDLPYADKAFKTTFEALDFIEEQLDVY